MLVRSIKDNVLVVGYCATLNRASCLSTDRMINLPNAKNMVLEFPFEDFIKKNSELPSSCKEVSWWSWNSVASTACDIYTFLTHARHSHTLDMFLVYKSHFRGVWLDPFQCNAKMECPRSVCDAVVSLLPEHRFCWWYELGFSRLQFLCFRRVYLKSL